MTTKLLTRKQAIEIVHKAAPGMLPATGEMLIDSLVGLGLIEFSDPTRRMTIEYSDVYRDVVNDRIRELVDAGRCTIKHSE